MKRMKILCVFIIFLFILFLVRRAKSASVDKTVEEKAFGTDVVDAVIRNIRRSQVFTDDYDFLNRIAFIESNFGEKVDTFTNNYFGGIWQVNQEEFLFTQEDQWKEFHQKIQNSFGFKYTELIWKDLLKPLYSGLAARLYLQTITNSLPQTIARQAVLWQKIYGRNDIRNRDFVTEITNYEANTLKCAGSLDLTAVLDGSASVGEDDFELSKNFVTNLFSNYSANSVRLGFIVFGDLAELVFGLDSEYSFDQKLEIVKNVSYPSESTNTNAGILMAVNMIKGSLPRPGVPSIMVVFTDGESNVGDGVSNIKLAEEARITTFAVGIGASINDTELLQIASNDSSRVLNVFDYSTLETLAHRIFTETCLVSAQLALAESYNDELKQNENRYFTLPINGKGLVVVKENLPSGNGTGGNSEIGETDGYYSFTEKNPSAAVNDGKLTGYTTIIRRPPGGKGPDQVFITVVGKKKQNNYSFVGIEGNDPEVSAFDEDTTTTTTTSTTAAPTTTTPDPKKVKEKANTGNKNKPADAEFWNIGNFKRLPNGGANDTHKCEDNQVNFKPFPGKCELYTLCACSVKVLLSCAPGLYFDPSISACNFIQLVPCQYSGPRSTIENPLDSA